MAKELTVEALRYYVPVFQKGDKALVRLLEESDIPTIERLFLENQVSVREIALDRLVELSRPLMISEISKIIKSSILKDSEDELFNVIFFAGVGGMVRGLRKFDVNKIDKSATNYLFQWITTYAKKEMLSLEAAPFAIPPSRFYKYKKISAVRKKMEEELGRVVSNDEVLAYFHDGFADVSNMNGPILKAKRSAANQAITMELIKEQDDFEKNMKKVALLEVDDFRNDLVLSDKDSVEGSILQIFAESSPELTDRAKFYLYSELGLDEIEIDSNMPTAEYRRLGKMWASLIKDPSGPFYNFLKPLSKDIDNIKDIIRDIEAGAGAGVSDYSGLFKEQK